MLVVQIFLIANLNVLELANKISFILDSSSLYIFFLLINDSYQISREKFEPEL